MRYKYLRDVPKAYRDETIDHLVDIGVIKGRSGSGDDMVIDLSEDSVRLLDILDRAGVFG